MRISSCLRAASFVAALVFPVLASAHTGGPLDADGCHEDHRDGSYHCHTGPAAGYSFPDRAAMQEAVRTGKFPEQKTADEEGFWSKLWPWGKHHHEQEADTEASGKDGSSASGPAAASVPAKQQEMEDKLKTLQGLYEMGLITKEEYEQKRKAVLDQL